MTILLYKCVVLCNEKLSRNIFTYIYLCIRNLIKKSCLFILKNKPIQTKIMSFSESMFKIVVILGRKLFLILLTLVVKI